MALILYHYTTPKALDRILAERRLLPSTAARSPSDVRYGDGVYLTDREPGTLTLPRLCARLTRMPFHWRKFTHYLALDVDGLGVFEGRAGIYVIRRLEPLEIAGRIVAHGLSLVPPL